jgi:hypothetical protein
MKMTIQYLLKGKSDIVEHYNKAVRLWQDILGEIDSSDSKAIANLPFSKQIKFESEFGKELGQEIMAVTAIAQYYDERKGFENNEAKAKAIYEGIMNSGFSSELKGVMQDVGKLYFGIV